jgi:hypothetical protein
MGFCRIQLCRTPERHDLLAGFPPLDFSTVGSYGDSRCISVLGFEMVRTGFCDVACHRLCQLRINFIGNGHHINQK